MFKNLRAKHVLPELIVSERNVYFIQKSRFISLALQKIIQIKYPWDFERYSTLLVQSIQDHGWINLKHDRILWGFFPWFVWDPYRIKLELSRGSNVIILASYKDLTNIWRQPQ